MKETWKKAMAATVLAAMTATQIAPASVWAAEVAQTAEADSKDKDAQAKENEENSAKLSGIVERTIKSSQESVDKEETVYVKTDASGKVDSVIVSDWLKNPEKTDSLSDVSKLTDIENVKGDETFKDNGDGTITWNAGGKDIYYQGKTDKEVPVQVAVSYKLDGKSVKPDDMAGKSGHVVIRFDYTNSAKQKVNVNGTEKDVVVPFVAITGMLLPTDTFDNVEVTNGKLISEGNNQIVVGYALPGLKESLGITQEMLDKKDDVSIPEYVEVEADVTNFEMGVTMTMAANNLLSEVDLNGKLDASDITDSINQLSSASNQLVDGTSQLANGVTELKGGLGQYVEGVEKLNNGLNTAEAGAAQLVAGYEGTQEQVGAVPAAQSLADGAGALATGAGNLATGAGNLAAGAAQLQGGVKTLTGAVTQMYTTVAGAMGQYANYQADIAAATGAYQQAMAAYQTVAAQVAAGEADASAMEAAAAGVQQAVTAMCNAYSEAGAYQALNTIKSGLDGQNLSESIAALEAGADSVANGANALSTGAQDVSDGANRLAGGSAQLNVGIQKLYNGTKALKDGVAQASEGSGKLVANNSKLLSGVDQLQTGSATLEDGMIKFNAQGIQKLVDVFGGDLKDLLDNTEAMKTASDAYGSFSGARDGATTNVKFLIQTASISAK